MVIYPRSLVGIGKSLTAATARAGWAVGQKPFMHFIGYPLVLLWEYTEEQTEKSDR